MYKTLNYFKVRDSTEERATLSLPIIRVDLHIYICQNRALINQSKQRDAGHKHMSSVYQYKREECQFCSPPPASHLGYNSFYSLAWE